MRVSGVRYVQGRNGYEHSKKYAIAVHATANPTSDASGEATYATRRTDGIGAHFYIDSTQVIQSLDTDDSTWHAGNWEGNSNAIALEFCGLNSWSRAKWLSSIAWDKVGAMLAAVSQHHGIPAAHLTVAQMKANAYARGAYDHNQMRLAWGGTDHTDPGPNFPWDKLLAVWQQHLNGEDDEMNEAQEKRLEQAAAASVEAVRLLVGIRTVVAGLGQVIAKESSSPDEVRALMDSLPQPPTAQQIADAVAARLPAGDNPVSREDLIAALRTVLGSVDGASPAS